MFLRCTTRKKNGKEHRYWNLVENRRVAGGQVIQRQVLYLGEINDSQREVWRKSMELFEELKLDQFWAERLPPGRKGTRWDLILQTLCIYRFIEPGSEWRLHRHW